MKKMNAAVISALSLAFLASCGGGPKEYTVGSDTHGLTISVTKAIEGQDFKAELGINTQQITDVIFPETLTKLTSGNKELQTADYTYTRKDDNKKADLVIPAANVVGDIDIELEFVTPTPPIPSYSVTIDAGADTQYVSIDKKEAKKGEDFVATISVDTQPKKVLPFETDVEVKIGEEPTTSYEYKPSDGYLSAEFKISSELVKGPININLKLRRSLVAQAKVVDGYASDNLTLYYDNAGQDDPVSKDSSQPSDVPISDVTFKHDFKVQLQEDYELIVADSRVKGIREDDTEDNIYFTYDKSNGKITIDSSSSILTLARYKKIEIYMKAAMLSSAVSVGVEFNDNVKELSWSGNSIQSGTTLSCTPFHDTERYGDALIFEFTIGDNVVDITPEDITVTGLTEFYSVEPYLSHLYSDDNNHWCLRISTPAGSHFPNFSFALKPVKLNIVDVTAKCKHLLTLVESNTERSYEFDHDETEDYSTVTFESCVVSREGKIVFVPTIRPGYTLNDQCVKIDNPDLTAHVESGRKGCLITVSGEPDVFNNFTMTITPQEAE